MMSASDGQKLMNIYEQMLLNHQYQGATPLLHYQTQTQQPELSLHIRPSPTVDSATTGGSSNSSLCSSSSKSQQSSPSASSQSPPPPPPLVAASSTSLHEPMSSYRAYVAAALAAAAAFGYPVRTDTGHDYATNPAYRMFATQPTPISPPPPPIVPMQPPPPPQLPHHRPQTAFKARTLNQSTGSSSSSSPSIGTEQEPPKPAHSYIGLIALAILSSPEKRLVLSDIYQYILDNYSYFHNRGSGWRNSIRHNLSLNDCFMKAGRSANGKGHYWTIHPANLDDFSRGDFRRRRAQRRVRRSLGLTVPEEDDEDDEEDEEAFLNGTGPPPASRPPPSVGHVFLRSPASNLVHPFPAINAQHKLFDTTTQSAGGIKRQLEPETPDNRLILPSTFKTNDFVNNHLKQQTKNVQM